ncbi:hypothetical protein ACMWQU_27030, partial [Escherichia coli]|uniref:hypothetical protein n=1 Tax=Escherichia coli TaxID=562 RepID=UPI0039E15EAC
NLRHRVQSGRRVAAHFPAASAPQPHLDGASWSIRRRDSLPQPRQSQHPPRCVGGRDSYSPFHPRPTLKVQ